MRWTLPAARTGVAGSIVGLALWGASAAVAAPAPVNCDQPNYQMGVSVMGMSAAQNIILQQQSDLTYQGQMTIRVFCMQGTTDLGEVTNAQVSITSTVPDVAVDGQPATGSGALINLPLGIQTVTITAPQSTLTPDTFFARVGGNTVVTVEAYGQSVPSGYSLNMNGNVFAATPELDSLALFGSGAIGLAGYLLLRRRAATK